MDYPLVECPEHGFQETEAYGRVSIPGSRSYENSWATCPIDGCNRMVPLVEARYGFSPAGLQVTSITPLGEWQLSRLRRVVEAARREANRGTAPEEILDRIRGEIRKEAPDLDPIMERASRSFLAKVVSNEAAAAYALISLLVTIISLFMNVQQPSVSDSVDQAVIDQIVEEKVREVLDEREARPEPSTTTPAEPHRGPEPE